MPPGQRPRGPWPTLWSVLGRDVDSTRPSSWRVPTESPLPALDCHEAAPKQFLATQSECPVPISPYMSYLVLGKSTRCTQDASQLHVIVHITILLESPHCHHSGCHMVVSWWVMLREAL